ncbi:Nuclear receptor 2C2-associated protein [Linderina pennispora]|nr:Nuclear receptor 2C2-associated protein [Linderina pennispora]
MSSLTPLISKCKVSSVLNRDAKSFGKAHLFDASLETCWNSDQGSPQYILVEFAQPVKIDSVLIQFQGGFVGKDIELIDAIKAAKICSLYADDNNKLQSFDVTQEEAAIGRSRIKILFNQSTDFYGRIVIYSLDFVGSTA